jgi:hypothetical protein
MTGSRTERRRAPRAPAHGTAILHGDHGVLVGNIENLSLGGVLISVSSAPRWAIDNDPGTLDIELRFGSGGPGPSSRVRARGTLEMQVAGNNDRPFAATGHPVRIEPAAGRVRIAVAFDRLFAGAEDEIEDEIEAALGAALSRPVLIIDDDEPRRRRLAVEFGARGMTPLVPRTPLEAIDLLSRTRLHVAVCAVAERFADIPSHELHAFLAEGFPWVRTLTIDDHEAELADHAFAIWQQAAEDMMPA